MEISRGKISFINEEGTAASCIPNESAGFTTQPLVIPFYWRSSMGNLQVGDEVFYLEDNCEPTRGYIIGRCDGEWDKVFRGTLEVTEDIKIGDLSVKEHRHKDPEAGMTGLPE